MKLYYVGEGDASVGIPLTEVSLEVNNDYPGIREMRVELRRAFDKFCSEFLDDMGGRHGVRFGDECPDCGTIKRSEEAECTHKFCIQQESKNWSNCPACHESIYTTDKKCPRCNVTIIKPKNQGGN